MKVLNELAISKTLGDLQQLDVSVKSIRKHVSFLQAAGESERSLIDARDLLNLSTQLRQRAREFEVPLRALMGQVESLSRSAFSIRFSISLICSINA